MHFDPELLVRLTSGTFEVITSALPPDVQVRDAGYDPEIHCFYVTLEHESFRPSELGQSIPSLPSPIITRLDP